MRAPDFIRDRAKVLRRAMTQSEQTLWALLRRSATGKRWRRQHPVGPYVLDFYCASLKLAIEVDGAGHIDLNDAKRTEWLAGEGIRVLRFTAAEIEERMAMVMASIACGAPPSTGSAGSPPP